MNKAEFIAGYEQHIRICRRYGVWLILFLVASTLVVGGLSIWLEDRNPSIMAPIILGIIVVVGVGSCACANAAVRHSAYMHDLRCFHCGKLFSQVNSAWAVIQTGACIRCKHTLFHDHENA